MRLSYKPNALKKLALLALPAAMMLTLVGCEERQGGLPNKHFVQVPPQTIALMASKGMTRHDAVLLRSYKKESELEVWKKNSSGEYALLKTYPMCRWSGQLGPKTREGDRQAPEGFYQISPAQMNPHSSFHLSFNIGYPNAFDRAYGRSGSHLMVHGACSSRGCYSMTDEQIEEIYALVRDAHSGGQSSVQMQALPFRMTPENLAKHRANPHIGFWKNLKEGADHFEVTKKEPKVAICSRKYVFNATGNEGVEVSSECPSLKVDAQIASRVREKQASDNQQVAELIAKGTPAIKVVYDDGDQHHSFKGTAFASVNDERATTPVFQRPIIAGVSRPEALINGPRIVELDPAGKPIEAKVVMAAQEPVKEVTAQNNKPTENATIAQTHGSPSGSGFMSSLLTPFSTTNNEPKPTVKPVVTTRQNEDNVATTASVKPVSASVSDDKPFYSRLFTPVTGLFGHSEPSPSSHVDPETTSTLAHPSPAPRPRGQAASRERLKETPTTLSVRHTPFR
jgi:murein L,D-transpeptidase YafK